MLCILDELKGNLLEREDAANALSLEFQLAFISFSLSSHSSLQTMKCTWERNTGMGTGGANSLTCQTAYSSLVVIATQSYIVSFASIAKQLGNYGQNLVPMAVVELETEAEQKQQLFIVFLPYCQTITY